jgi:hypothetical protein
MVSLSPNFTFPGLKGATLRCLTSEGEGTCVGGGSPWPKKDRLFYAWNN